MLRRELLDAQAMKRFSLGTAGTETVMFQKVFSLTGSMLAYGYDCDRTLDFTSS